MERLRAPWLVGLPLLAAAWLSAHGLAYELLPPGGHGPDEALAATGHAYLEPAPLVLAGLLVVAVAAALHRCVTGRPGGRALSPWLFGALPLFGFAVQEHLERLLHGAGGAWATGAEPVFLLGLALQIPFALAAVVVARSVLAAADGLAHLGGPPPRRPRRASAPLALPRAVDPTPVPALARRDAGRAPPAPR